MHAEDRPLVDAFRAREEDETGEIPDLLLRFEVPFAPAHGYGARLLDVLRSSSDPDPDVEAPWVCPPPPSEGDAPPPGPGFVRACASLIEHDDDLLEYLVVVLTPAADPDPAVWHPWLLALLAAKGYMAPAEVAEADWRPMGARGRPQGSA